MSQYIEPTAAATPVDPNAPPAAPAAPAVAPAGSELAPPAAPTPAEPAQQPTWAIERIDGLTKDKRTLQAENAELKAKLAPAPLADGTAPAPTFDPVRYRQDVEKGIQQSRFTDECNSIAARGQEKLADGKEKYPGFAIGVAALNTLGALNPDFIDALKEAGDPAELLAHLGGDMAEFSRITSLSPAKQGVALAKFANTKRAAAPAKPTLIPGAPPPHEDEVRGSAPAVGLEDNLPVDEWMRRRDAEELKALGLA